MKRWITFALAVATSSASAQDRYQWNLTKAEGYHEYGVTDFHFHIADSGQIGELAVGIILPNTWQGDYKWELLHGGVNVLLIDRPGHPERPFGFSADHYGNLQAGAEFVLSNAGANRYDVPDVSQPGIPLVTGTWQSDGDLSAFDALDRNGKWTLRITDMGAGDIGVLRQFSLTMVPEPNTALMLGLFATAALASRARCRRIR